MELWKARHLGDQDHIAKVDLLDVRTLLMTRTLLGIVNASRQAAMVVISSLEVDRYDSRIGM
jgi:hypothetical protein